MTYDRGLKREFYQQMPSVQVYLIIDQHRVLAELYTRADVGWLMQVFESIDDVISLKILDCELALGADLPRHHFHRRLNTHCSQQHSQRRLDTRQLVLHPVSSPDMPLDVYQTTSPCQANEGQADRFIGRAATGSRDACHA